jgi:cytochrome bd-type quinol oxidase subunit 2
MREWRQDVEDVGQKRKTEGVRNARLSLNQKYWVALLLYGVLAVLVWFTVGEGRVIVFGKPVELRLIPMLILATFALRTVLVRQADKIRHGGE